MKAHSTHRGLLQAALLLLTLLVLTAGGAFAQIRIDLHDFNATSNGSFPQAAVVLGTDGNFYGTTYSGGAASVNGSIYKITPSGSLTTLYSFSGKGDGANPAAALVQGIDGNFYGSTELGGLNGKGTVFKLTPSGSFTTLYSFSGTDGINPLAALVQGTDGNFYGTTEYGGGTENEGTIFKITPSGSLTTLYTFSNLEDGTHPIAALVQGTDGNFYGTTYSGGTSDLGTVFKITPSGTLTTLHSFTWYDGSFPEGTLLQGSDGNFYGTTSDDGTYSVYSGGTVFKITPSGTLTTLYFFGGGVDGAYLLAGLVQGGDGNFYGTTSAGGDDDQGTIFKMTTTGGLTTLYSFFGPHGEYPEAALTQGADGTFYGTTYQGGRDGKGTIFNTTSTGSLTTLYTFGGGEDGIYPSAPVQGTDGDFYGTTQDGGPSGMGTIFKLTSEGQLTTLYSFSGPDGGRPWADLVRGTDGNFYGTTETGGAANQGTIFKITASGILNTLYSFSGPDGSYPESGLTNGADGNFYGTTFGGGTAYEGTIFKFTPTGSLTTLYSFSYVGSNPRAALVQGSDGSFYGTTLNGGTTDQGTIYQMTTTGSVNTLYSFSGPDGAAPNAALVQGTDGNFYGTTTCGGISTLDPIWNYCNGTIFKITPTGTLTTVYFFSGPDGGDPQGALIQGTDGNLYGSTSDGGALWVPYSNYGDGTIFRITPSGILTSLYSFSGSDGANPQTALVLGTNGNLYGTTYYGGQFLDGTAFELVLSLAAPTGLTATADNAQIVLSWTASVYATSYNIYRSTVRGGETLFATGITGTLFTDTSIVDNTTYYYRVGAVNASGIAESAEVSAPTVPASPTSLMATGGAGEVSLAWTASSGATSYCVFRSTRLGAESQVQSGVTAALFEDSTVLPGTSYYYRVAAVNSMGTSELSDGASTMTIPAVPTGVTATAENTRVRINFNASIGASRYVVYISTTSGGENSTSYLGAGGPSGFTDLWLTNGVTYYFTVAAVDSSGTSAQSTQVSATPIGAPSKPSGLAAVGSPGQVSLNWNPTPGATSYNLCRSTVHAGEALYQSDIAGTSFVDNDVSNGVTYYYRLVAVNAGGETYSSEVKATP